MLYSLQSNAATLLLVLLVGFGMKNCLREYMENSRFNERAGIVETCDSASIMRALNGRENGRPLFVKNCKLNMPKTTVNTGFLEIEDASGFAILSSNIGTLPYNGDAFNSSGGYDLGAFNMSPLCVLADGVFDKLQTIKNDHVTVVDSTTSLKFKPAVMGGYTLENPLKRSSNGSFFEGKFKDDAGNFNFEKVRTLPYEDGINVNIGAFFYPTTFNDQKIITMVPYSALQPAISLALQDELYRVSYIEKVDIKQIQKEYIDSLYAMRSEGTLDRYAAEFGVTTGELWAFEYELQVKAPLRARVKIDSENKTLLQNYPTSGALAEFIAICVLGYAPYAWFLYRAVTKGITTARYNVPTQPRQKWVYATLHIPDFGFTFLVIFHMMRIHGAISTIGSNLALGVAVPLVCLFLFAMLREFLMIKIYGLQPHFNRESKDPIDFIFRHIWFRNAPTMGSLKTLDNTKADDDKTRPSVAESKFSTAASTNESESEDEQRPPVHPAYQKKTRSVQPSFVVSNLVNQPLYAEDPSAAKNNKAALPSAPSFGKPTETARNSRKEAAKNFFNGQRDDSDDEPTWKPQALGAPKLQGYSKYGRNDDDFADA